MVGTSSTSVTRSFWIAAATPSGVKPWMTTLEPPLQQHRIHRRAIGEVEHRCGMQVDRAARPHAFAERVQRIDHQIAMAEHHALGTAGGAAGVEDAGRDRRSRASRPASARCARSASRNSPCRRASRRRRHRPASGPGWPWPAWCRPVQKPCRRTGCWRGNRAWRPRSRAGLQRMLSGTITVPDQPAAR